MGGLDFCSAGYATLQELLFDAFGDGNPGVEVRSRSVGVMPAVMALGLDCTVGERTLEGFPVFFIECS